MNYITHIILAILLAVSPYTASSKEKEKNDRKIIYTIGLDFKPNYILPTHEFFRGENKAEKNITTNISGHLKYGFKFTQNTDIGRMYPYAIQGIGIGYNTFSNKTELGNPISIYVFQSSRITSIAPRLSLDYEWNFGASFLWEKYDYYNNPYNRVVGSKANAYISLDLLLDWKITEGTSLRVGFGLSHYSNGNTSYPNSGVNTTGVSIGIRHSIGENTQKTFKPYRNDFRKYTSYDLIVYGATKKKGVFPEGYEPMLAPGVFGVLGLNFNPLYNINKYFRAGASLDIQYDESANIGKHISYEHLSSDECELLFYKPSFKEQFSAGISLRAEVVMPFFAINIGIGKNFICHGEDTNSFYQNFVLKTNITRNVFIHTGYQLYRFKDPNNLMLGIGYRFNAR